MRDPNAEERRPAPPTSEFQACEVSGAAVPPWWVNWQDAEPNDWNSAEDAGGVYGGTAGNAGKWNDWTPTLRRLIPNSL